VEVLRILYQFLSSSDLEESVVLGNLYAWMVNEVFVSEGAIPPGLLQVLSDRGYTREEIAGIHSKLFSEEGDAFSRLLELRVEDFIGGSVPSRGTIQPLVDVFLEIKLSDILLNSQISRSSVESIRSILSSTSSEQHSLSSKRLLLILQKLYSINFHVEGFSNRLKKAKLKKDFRKFYDKKTRQFASESDPET